MIKKKFFFFFYTFLILLLLFSVFYLFSGIIFTLLFAYIIYYSLKPFVLKLERKGIKHNSAALIVFISSLSVFLIFLFLLTPVLLSEFSNIQNNFDDYVKVFLNKIDNLKSSFSSRFNFISFGSDNNSIQYNITTYLKNNSLKYLQLLSNLIIYIIVIPFAVFFFLYDEQKIKKSFISFVPNRYFETTLNVLYGLNRQFGLILYGMALTVVIFSVLASIGLWLIKLDFPIFVGIIGGVSNLIPYFGPIVGIIAASLVAVVTGAPFIIYLKIALVFVILNIIDNIFIQPLVLAKSADLHPLIVIVLVLAGSAYGGVLGMLLIVPAVSLIKVVVIILFKDLSKPGRPDFSQYKDIP